MRFYHNAALLATVIQKGLMHNYICDSSETKFCRSLVLLKKTDISCLKRLSEAIQCFVPAYLSAPEDNVKSRQ
jgi:hypothetical protein